jgi:hypothetical protein
MGQFYMSVDTGNSPPVSAYSNRSRRRPRAIVNEIREGDVVNAVGADEFDEPVLIIVRVNKVGVVAGNEIAIAVVGLLTHWAWRIGELVFVYPP